MNKTAILTIGGNGLVGSRVRELLADDYNFEDASRRSGLDITNADQVAEKIKSSSASVVIHFAAKADVEGCEKDREDDTKILGYTDRKKQEESFATMQTAWAVNVIGTRNVAKACEQNGKKLLYISTDFVFGSEEPKDGGFIEEDMPGPVNWYGQTKYEGEKIIQGLKTPWIIIRIAYPYRARFDTKKDFVRVFLSLLQQGKQLKLITDHLNNATFVDDIAFAIDQLIQQNAAGIYHVTGSQSLSPYEQGIKITEIFNLDKNLIGQTTRAEFFKDRAPRPFSLAMNNAKIRKLDVNMRTFEEGLVEIKRQIENITS